LPRRIARGSCYAVIALLFLPAVALAAFGDRPLRLGMYGKDVRVLQVLLTRAGFRTVADGSFGQPTRRAVRRREGASRRRVNGWVGRRDVWAPAAGARRRPPASEPAASRRPMLLGARRRPAITAEVQAPGRVTADVLDDAGKVVATVSREVDEPGQVTLRWNGRAGGKPAPEGTYSLRLAARARATGTGTATALPPTAFRLRHHRFPIQGRHDLGRSATNGFGGGRGHQGHDMFARCGTPVVAAQGGSVRLSGYHAAAGHYLVIRGSGTGEDYVYMHLRDAPSHHEGDEVATGTRLGAVGQSGRASGCHLHFELWTRPGWYQGGEAYDPLPKLREWDGWS
jgi:murein DD-endopeptidase MepM/ murein hydrolase activator NlpD